MRNKTFGKVIRVARANKELTQQELADICRVTSSYLSHLESDRVGYPPSEKVLIRLATALELSSDELRELSGRAVESCSKLVREVCRRHPEFAKIASRMSHDPNYAKAVLDYAIALLPSK